MGHAQRGCGACGRAHRAQLDRHGGYGVEQVSEPLRLAWAGGSGLVGLHVPHTCKSLNRIDLLLVPTLGIPRK